MRQPPRQCSIRNCSEPYFARDWCKIHYYRAQRHNGDPQADKPIGLATSRKPEQPRQCKVRDCEAPHYGRGYCLRHYQRWKEYGDAEEPLRRGRNGTGYRGVNNQGYVVLKYGPVTILEHRQVMEQRLGRKLHPFENVHHKNGVKTDNAPENLEVWVKVQPCGQRLEDLIAFVTANYPDEVRAAMAGT
jgi:HNH endonuclease